MQLMEDEQVSISAFATYILNNQKVQVDALLETDRKEMLDFGEKDDKTDRSKYSLRQFVGLQVYTEIVLKVVEFNGGSTFENSEINIILLDKIKHHDKVINYLIQMQLNAIDRFKPREFLRPSLDTETIQQVLSKKLA